MAVMTIEQIADEALSLPSEARALLADRLVESLDPAEDGLLRKLWANEALKRRDEVRSGLVRTIPAEEAIAKVRRHSTASQISFPSSFFINLTTALFKGGRRSF